MDFPKSDTACRINSTKNRTGLMVNPEPESTSACRKTQYRDVNGITSMPWQSSHFNDISKDNILNDKTSSKF